MACLLEALALALGPRRVDSDGSYVAIASLAL